MPRTHRHHWIICVFARLDLVVGRSRSGGALPAAAWFHCPDLIREPRARGWDAFLRGGHGVVLALCGTTLWGAAALSCFTHRHRHRHAGASCSFCGGKRGGK